MIRAGCAALWAWVGGCSSAPARDEGAQPTAAVRAAAEEIGADWVLAGSHDERFVRLAGQLRGWDVTMVEVGYRYSMLYWAGLDRNWEFGRYQIKKMVEAIGAGVVRRPEYRDRVRMLDGAIANMNATLAAHDDGQVKQRFAELTAVCNACHQATEHPWIQIRTPTVRVSPASQAPEDTGAR